MKTIFHLSIHARKGERQKWLSVFFTDKEKAIGELKRWAATYKDKWNVPEKSNAEWYLGEKYTSDTNIDFQSIGRNIPREERCYFSGNVFENFMMEEGEEINCMCGEVFAAGDNPDILFINSSPILINKTAFSGQEPINIATEERTDFSQVSGGAVIQNEEKANEYYNTRSKLIKGETHKCLSSK